MDQKKKSHALGRPKHTRIVEGLCPQRASTGFIEYYSKARHGSPQRTTKKFVAELNNTVGCGVGGPRVSNMVKDEGEDARQDPLAEKSQKEQRLEDESEIIDCPGTTPSKSYFPGPVAHKEDKERREGRKRGEPRVQGWSLV